MNLDPAASSARQERPPIELVRHGKLALEGRLVTASNATFYCGVSLDGMSANAVYKPIRGERPLWDFPNGTLAGREVATYRLSEATGWGVVPPTVLRDGPFGEGMCQLWIDEDDADTAAVVDLVPREAVPAGWRRVLDAYDGDDNEITLVHADTPGLRHMALLDVIANNADRKGGHILVARSGAIHGVDHGLCFNVEDKLRTVLWGWAGERLDAEELAVLDRLDDELSGGPATVPGGGLRTQLCELIAPDEVEALHARVRLLRAAGRFPEPVEGWPSIPWPVF